MEYVELEDLKYIKKYYGEKMSNLCRSLFPTILEKPGLLYFILTTHFNPSKYLYEDVVRYKENEIKFKGNIFKISEENKSLNNGIKDLKTKSEELTKENQWKSGVRWKNDTGCIIVVWVQKEGKTSLSINCLFPRPAWCCGLPRTA